MTDDDYNFRQSQPDAAINDPSLREYYIWELTAKAADARQNRHKDPRVQEDDLERRTLTTAGYPETD